MEFENPTSSPSSVTDEQRLLAQTKQVTLKPLNPFLKPEDAPDPIVVNEIHSNVDRDTENTSEKSHLMQPSTGALRAVTDSTKKHSLNILLLLSSIIGGVGFGIIMYIFATHQ